jgi:hypothetical protein
MTAHDVAIVRRPRRRTHLADEPVDGRVSTWCGLDVPAVDASVDLVQLIGGPTYRLVVELRRHLDATTCLRCRRLAGVVAILHDSRDRGRTLLSA